MREIAELIRQRTASKARSSPSASVATFSVVGEYDCEYTSVSIETKPFPARWASENEAVDPARHGFWGRAVWSKGG